MELDGEPNFGLLDEVLGLLEELGGFEPMLGFEELGELNFGLLDELGLELLEELGLELDLDPDFWANVSPAVKANVHARTRAMNFFIEISFVCHITLNTTKKSIWFLH